MSKQKRGMFRRMIATIAMTMGFAVTHHYPDPVFKDSRGIPQRRKKRGSGQSSRGRFRRTKELALKVPSCVPGTITYHDKMTRHFGHKVANDFRRHYIKAKRTTGMDIVVPSKQEFADNPPWAFLK